MRKLARYGWRKQLPDHRDKRLKLTAPVVLPPSMDYRFAMPPIYDQGDTSSCTGNSSVAAVEYLNLAAGKPYVPLSRIFPYYGARIIEGGPVSDSGAEIRDVVQAMNAFGIPPESVWPFDPAQINTEPPAAAYVAATHDYVVQYYAVDQTEKGIKTALVSGYPIVFGFTVYDYFESDEMAAAGILKLPQPNEQVVGGHAVLCVGYTDDGYYWVRNSWGKDWGPYGGYFKMPAAYILNPDLASDFWVIQQSYQGA